MSAQDIDRIPDAHNHQAPPTMIGTIRGPTTVRAPWNADIPGVDQDHEPEHDTAAATRASPA